MRTFAQRQSQPQKPASDSPARRSLATSRPAHRGHPTASSRIGCDFSQIPLHPPTAGTLQTKLAINQPGDVSEQEANRVSERVIRMPEPQLQRSCACGGECPECQEEQPVPGQGRLQRSRGGPGDRKQAGVPPIVHEVLRSPGQPLDLRARGFMEPRIGYDFSRVRVHTDESAQRSARAINAHAYTVGNNIVFGPGRFNSQAQEGRRLLAHELTHVVQQSEGRGPLALARQPADAERLERKNEQKAPSQSSNCERGCAQRWGQETTCSLYGFVQSSRDPGDNTKKWKNWRPTDFECCNSWPFALEEYARNQLGLNGAASCHSTHKKKIATISFADKEPVQVLCSDTISEGKFGEMPISRRACSGKIDKEVIEMSPKAMLDLSGQDANALPVSVCYSGSTQDLCTHNGPGPTIRTGSDRNPEIGDCLTKGCPVPENTPKRRETGWRRS
jgi:hypothetical protein